MESVSGRHNRDPTQISAVLVDEIMPKKIPFVIAVFAVLFAVGACGGSSPKIETKEQALAYVVTYMESHCPDADYLVLNKRLYPGSGPVIFRGFYDKDMEQWGVAIENNGYMFGRDPITGQAIPMLFRIRDGGSIWGNELHLTCRPAGT